MWGKLQGLNKLKDIAVDMVAPRVQHHDDSDNDDDSGNRRDVRRGGNVLSPAAAHDGTARLRTSAAAAEGLNRGAVGTTVDPHQDLLDRIMALEADLTQQRLRTRTVEHQLAEELKSKTASSSAVVKQQQQGGGSRSSSLNASLSNIAQALIGGSGDDTATRLEAATQDVQRLQNNVQMLERHRDQVVQEAQQYAVEVKKAHDATVDYYDRKLKAQHDDFQQRLVALEASKTLQQETLLADISVLNAQVQELRGQNHSLEVQLEKLKKDSEDVKSADKSRDIPSLASDVSLPSMQRALAQSEERLHAAEESVRHIQRLSSERQLAAQRELDALRKQHAAELASLAAKEARSELAAKEAAERLRERDAALSEAHATLEQLRTAGAATSTLLGVDVVTHQAQQEDALRESASREILNRQKVQQLEEALQQSETHRKSELDESAREIDALRCATSAMQSTIASLTEQLTTASSQIAERHQQPSVMNEGTRDLETTIAALESTNRALRDQVDVLLSREAEFKLQSEAIATHRGTLEVELDAARSRCAQLQCECERLRQDSEAAAARAQQSAEASHVAEVTCAQLRHQITAQQQELDSLQRSRETDRAVRSHEEQSTGHLRSRIEELEGECQRLQTLQQQVLATCQEALSKANVVLPQSRGAGVADLMTILASEFIKYYLSLVEAQKVQAQWEATYAQAKDVNQNLNAQLREAQRQCSETRSEVQAKDRSITNLQTLLREEKEKLQLLQESVSAHSDVVRKSDEERRVAHEERQKVLRDKITAEERCQVLMQELDALRGIVQEKEDEATQAHQSAANLQVVLEQFQRSKQREVEERTLYLQHEMDLLKSELVGLDTMKQKHREEVEQLIHAHRKDMASKAVVITCLQTKLGEMKRALEETMTQLSDEHMIDKRVVSHLVVNFVHSVALQRGDEEDMLKVMCGLLNWDELTQQKAGLLPGPLNPKRNVARSLVGGLVKSVWSSRQGGDVKAVATSDEDAKRTAPRSIAEMWVEFLIKEGEDAKRSGGTSASIDNELDEGIVGSS